MELVRERALFGTKGISERTGKVESWGQIFPGLGVI